MRILRSKSTSWPLAVWLVLICETHVCKWPYMESYFFAPTPGTAEPNLDFFIFGGMYNGVFRI